MVKSKEYGGKHYLKDFLKIAPLSHAIWRSVEALVFKQVQFSKPILDIGCGFGEFAGVVFDQLEMGIDINEKELKQALKGKKYRKVLWADARKLPFKANTFSTVVSVSVLEHIKNTEEAIVEINRILKKGGVFAFTVPTTSMYKHMLIPKICRLIRLEVLGKIYFREHAKIFKHQALYPADWWAKKLKKANFKIISQQGTISPTALKISEIFLPLAAPSQLWKLLSGRRLIISAGIRSKVLPIFFAKFISVDQDSDINVFFLAKKV